MTDPAHASIPLAQAVEEYLDWQALDRARSPNTVRAYTQDLRLFLTHCTAAGATRLGHLDPELLRGYQSDLARGPGRPAPVSAATRHRRLVALRSFLRYCAREDWTPGDLGATIDLPQLPRRLPKPLTDPELRRLTTHPNPADTNDTAGPDTADTDPTGPDPADADPATLRDRALVAFLLSTGARISEALTLDRTDWHTHQVIVRGKGDTERTVVITDRARTAMNNYLTTRTDTHPALFLSYSPGRTRRLTVRGAEAVCARLGTRNQIPKLHPHRFRHTAGSTVQDELGDPRLTADYLGHHGLATVTGYTEISTHRRAEAGNACGGGDVSRPVTTNRRGQLPPQTRVYDDAPVQASSRGTSWQDEL